MRSLSPPRTVLKPVRPPGGPLKILLPLEPRPLFLPGSVSGSCQIMLPLEPGQLLCPRDPKTIPKTAKDRSRAAKIGERPPQDAVKIHQEPPRGSQPRALQTATLAPPCTRGLQGPPEGTRKVIFDAPRTILDNPRDDSATCRARSVPKILGRRVPALALIMLVELCLF